MLRRQQLSAGVDHFAASSIIGRQFVSWVAGGGEAEHYRWQIAPARNYAESPDVSDVGCLSTSLLGFNLVLSQVLCVQSDDEAEQCCAGRSCQRATLHNCAFVRCEHCRVKTPGHCELFCLCPFRRRCLLLLLLQSLQRLRAQGYVKGGTADCSIIGYGDRWYDPAQVHILDLSHAAVSSQGGFFTFCCLM